MNKSLGIAAAVLTAVSLMSFANLTSAGDAFHEGNLHGTYAFCFEGEAFAGPALGEIRGVGRIEMDGLGNITWATRTINVGGNAIQGQTATGWYVVNPDGTGSMTFTPTDPTQPTATSDIVLVDKRRIMFVNTDPGFTVSGEAVKQRP